jgi:hypothetical protein
VTKPLDDELDLDDGPVLAGERVWPAALPQAGRRGPPPPPPARRARGTAPLGEPMTSGLIDVRAMAAAYAAEREAEPAAPAPAFAEGTSPLPLVSPERVPAAASRRAIAISVVAIGGALAAAAVFAGSLLLGDERGSDRAPEAAARPRPIEAPPLVIRADEVIPEVRVIPLPTTITEVAPPPAAPTRPKGRLAGDGVGPRAAARASLPVRPSNSEIASAVVAARNRLDACGDAHGTTGSVPVSIQVEPSGAISAVEVAAGRTSFRRCVASALRRQRLPASQVGTSARFPVLVR